MNNGTIYIASMNMRGKWAQLPENTNRINVTSAQSKTSPYRLAFSPMTPIKNKYKGFYCFENYWQSGKRYQDLDSNSDIKKQLEWWRDQKTGKRRYHLAKGKTVKYAIFENFTKPLYYIDSRKKVYVPEYYNLIKKLDIIKQLKNNIKKGISYTIYDFDGPRTNNGDPTVLKLSLDILKNKINDPTYPFGHGYIVAATLLGIEPESYI